MKEHTIDARAREYRLLQEQYADRAENPRIMTAFLLIAAVILFAFGTAIFVLPQKSVSEEENRTLQTPPTLSLDAVLSGKYTAELATFYADQFPMRSKLVALKAISEAALLKQENNGILIGKNGYLIDRLEYGVDAYRNLDANLAAVKAFSKTAEEMGIPCAFLAAPRTVDVMQTAYPSLYSDVRASIATQKLAAADPNATALIDLLREKADSGEYVMYKTDHHWTTLGAYYAYSALGARLGYTPLPRTHFREDTVSDAFRGTTYSASGIKWTDTDTVTLYRAADDGDYTVTVHDSGEAFRGFYDLAALDGKDKYSVFLGGNYGHVSVKREGEDRPTLLLVKDSYALSAVPFLARHFNLELIDLRYFSGATAPLLEDADAVLILLGVDSLASSNLLKKLFYGTQ